MGNQLAQPQRLHPDQLAELPNVVFKKMLGGGRLLKTVQCVHDAGALVVKVYQTRGEPVDLKPYEQQLTEIRDRLMSVPHSHLWPFQVFVRNESAGFLVRPFIYSNLYDRMSTRPFLNNIEKRWMAFQLLHALKQCHDKRVCHGDVKCENVLVTSWNWVFLTDFASYKPVYLPADNPANFSYYFDIGSRRRCYVAPERFFEGSGKSLGGNLLPSMDIFSAGCVIAELFLDGRALFDLSQLLSFRKGDYEVDGVLGAVDPGVRELIQHMIQLDPGSRLSAGEYLDRFTPSVFPEYFAAALHPFFGSVLATSPDTRVLQVKTQFHALKEKILGIESRQVANGKLGDLLPGKESSKNDLDLCRNLSSSSRGASTGPSAYITAGQSGNLLEEVGALLSDMEQTHSQVLRMAASEGREDGEGGRNFLGESVGSIVGAEDNATVPDGCSQVEEVVTEEIHQYQIRDSTGEFVELSNVRDSMLPEDEPHQFRQKGDVRLPQEGGWQWVSDWEVDAKGSYDSEGWKYKGRSNSGMAIWEADSSPNSVWRRRRWVRKRIRRRSLKHVSSSPWTNLPESEPIPNEDSAAVSEGMVMILVLLCTLVRASKLQESRRCAVALLYEAAAFCDDECRLQRAVPHLLSLVSDPSASIRALALHYLIKILGSIQSIPPSDSRIFQDYILPSLSLLPNDPEELVRVEYAAGIPRLTACAGWFLRKEDGEEADMSLMNTELGLLWKKVDNILYELGSGDKSNANTRRAVLERVNSLADFFGRNCVSELLMVLFTFLNDADWRLWASFFACVKDIIAKSGSHTVDALTPFLEQGLHHSDPSVISNSLDLLCHICVHARFRKCRLLQMCQKVVHMLRDHNACVRARAIDFLVVAAKVLSPADAYSRLLPLVQEVLSKAPSMPPVHLAALSSPTMMAELVKLLPPIPKLAEDRTSAAMNLEEDMVLDAKAAVYSTNLDKKLLQCGLTKHKAALEGRKKETANTPPNPTGDVRSEAALLTWGIIQGADKVPMYATTNKLGTLPSSVRYIDAVPGGQNPWVRNQMVEALNTPLNINTPVMSLDPSAVWRPRGVLLAHLAEHRRAVNCLAVAGKERHNPFFVSASNDGTVKVWDLRHLERDVNFHSRLTYGAQDGKILSVTFCDDGRSVASASSNGSIHVWRVQYVQHVKRGGKDEYSGITSQQKLCPSEGAILEVKQWGPLLLYVTQRGGVHAWDTRMKRDAWVLPVTPRLGLVEHMTLDLSDQGTWLLTGSSRGYLSLWDARFHLQVNGWRHPKGCPVDALSTAIAPADWLGARGYSGSGPLVYVLAGGNEVGLWDIEEGRCRQVLRVIPREETEVGKMERPAALQVSSTPENENQFSNILSPRDPMRMGFEKDLAIHELYMPQPRLEGIRAVFPLSYGGVLTGGSDACVRLWDGQEPKQSYVVCGPSVIDRKRAAEGHPQIQYKYQYSHHMLHEVSIVDECCLPTHSRAPPTAEPFENIVRMDDNCHKDCITGVAMAEVAERMLLTCGRDGVVKAWR